MIRPSLKQLSYLTALEEAQSFSLAADKCAVTQSTLSAGIKELETIIGQKLVTRGRKRTTLTPFGAEVAQQAQQMLGHADSIMARARLLDEPLSGPLRLGIIPTIAPYKLPDILPRIAKAYPKLELQLSEDLTERLLHKLERGEIDVALLAFPYETPGMEQLIIYEEPFYAAVPKDHHSKAAILDIKDIKPEELLLLEDGHCLRDHALSACKIQPARQRKAFSATSLQTLIQMVQHGMGITLLPEMATDQKALPSGIKIIPLKGKQKPIRQIGLCWRKNNPHQSDFKLLAQQIK